MVLLLFGAGQILIAQDYQEALRSANEQRINTQKTGMQVRGIWAIGNVTLGLTLRGGATGPERHFHGMNTAWNVVNFGLATAVYIRNANAEKSRYTLSETVKKSMNLQKVYLLAAGLDAAFVAGGFYMRERSLQSDNPDMLRGFGNSFILQGGFLMLYDLVLFYAHSRVLQPALKWMDKLQPVSSANGVGFRLNF